MKNTIKILRSLFVLSVFAAFGNTVHAASVNLTIRDGNTIIFEDTVSLPDSEENVDLNDSAGNSHSLSNSSVLYTITQADESDDSWSISDLSYYDSFGSFYLKCITSSAGKSCDNWQYAVDGSTPFSSMDQNILSGDESVYVYFGSPSRVLLSSSSITTSESVTVTAQNYDYENNAWDNRDGVTIGLTETNPDDAFNPIEIQTKEVDENGEAIFSGITIGTYGIGVKEDFYFPQETLSVTKVKSSGGGSSSKKSKKTTPATGKVLGTASDASFDQDRALNFLIANQNIDGSFGEDIYTDWTALALGNTDEYKLNINALKQYLLNNKPSGTLLTDYERRSMALLALGLNPYNANGENYISKIVSSFDGQQFGDPVEGNDDIFALIVLQNAGYKSDEKIILDTINFILSKQTENGSWNESIDMTGAAMQALYPFIADEKVKLALDKAKEFLKENQNKETSAWTNVSSTAWAWGGLTALGETKDEWAQKDLSPVTFLASNQESDGGIKGDNTKNRIWETAYALTTMSGSTWNDIMIDVAKTTTSANILPTPITKPLPSVKPSSKKVSTIKKTAPVVTQAMPEAVIQNTPSVIDASPAPTESAAPKKNWVKRLFGF